MDVKYALIALAMQTGERDENDERCNLPLHKQLEVEEISPDEYKGHYLWRFPFMQGPYGGLLMAQALMAAHLSVTRIHPTFLLQSYHCYFIRAVRLSPDVVYKVERTSVRSRMCSVLVSGVQIGQVCFRCLVLFEKPGSLNHILDMCTDAVPDVPVPLTVVEDARSQDYKSCKNLLQVICLFVRDRCGAFDIYECSSKKSGSSSKPRALCWNRMKPSSARPVISKHQNLDRISIVYGSDMTLTYVAALNFPNVKIHGVYSVDHSMWFYGHVREDDWYLYCNELEHSYGGRTFNSARIYSEKGDLVAICKQQSVLKSKI